MVLAGENTLYSTKNFPVLLLSTKNPTWTDIKWNLGLRGEMPETERPSHSTALKTTSDVNCVYTLSSYRAVNTLRLGYTNQSVNAV